MLVRLSYSLTLSDRTYFAVGGIVTVFHLTVVTMIMMAHILMMNARLLFLFQSHAQIFLNLNLQKVLILLLTAIKCLRIQMNLNTWTTPKRILQLMNALSPGDPV